MTKTTAKTTTKAVKNRPASATRVVREAIIPEDYQPIGMWGYFGYQFLFSIPIIGWVLCISFALMARNHNLRNFSRSQFCYVIIGIIIFCLLAGFGVLQTMFESLGII